MDRACARFLVLIAQELVLKKGCLARFFEDADEKRRWS
jgi:hypothetical protein